MIYHTRLGAIGLLLLLAGAAQAATKWTIDEDHSSANFKIRHMMVSNVRGQFTGATGEFTIDESDWKKVKATVRVPTKTVNTSNEKRDKHLRSKDFFWSAKYPVMIFESRKFTPGKKGAFDILGRLTIRGKSKTVTFKSDGFTDPVKGPWGKTRRGFAATTTINRKDFGLSWNKALDNGGLVVGDEVEVTVEMELIQAEDQKS